MAARLDHTIVAARDALASATFLAEVLGLDPPVRMAHFQAVVTGNGVSLDFAATDDDIVPQHYAFLVDEDDFDAIFGRVRDRGLPYWAYPQRRRPNEINTDHGRRVYFPDPAGHYLEILTRSYGS